MARGALDGVRVLDLSHVIAGPTASHYLALEGAEVIKVEHPAKGDILRGSNQHLLDEGIPVGFAALNAGKRSLGLDVKHPRGKQLLEQLIKSADVFIENFRPGAVARLGFGFEQVRALKPDIVYASISGYGQQGRWSQRAAYDHVVQAAVGMNLMQGEEGQEPIKVGFPVIDTATGMVAAKSILAALMRRFRFGEGAHLDISMAQAALQLMWPDAARALVTGKDAPRVGNRGFSGSPGAATFRCSDGWIATAANTAEQFGALCTALGLAAMPQDAELIDQGALRHGGFVVAKDMARAHALLARAMAGQRVDPLEARLAAASVPCAKLLGLSELLAQATAGDLMSLPVRKTAYPNGVFTDFGGGCVVDRQAGTPLPPAPRLGQHTAELLGSLGVDAAELKQLCAQGIVRC